MRSKKYFPLIDNISDMSNFVKTKPFKWIPGEEKRLSSDKRNSSVLTKQALPAAGLPTWVSTWRPSLDNISCRAELELLLPEVPLSEELSGAARLLRKEPLPPPPGWEIPELDERSARLSPPLLRLLRSWPRPAETAEIELAELPSCVLFLASSILEIAWARPTPFPLASSLPAPGPDSIFSSHFLIFLLTLWFFLLLLLWMYEDFFTCLWLKILACYTEALGFILFQL